MKTSIRHLLNAMYLHRQLTLTISDPVFAPRKIKSSKKGKSKLAAIAEKVDDILNKGDLQLNIKANHVNMKNFNADNVVAQLLFHGNDWEIQKANLSHAGGNMSLTGNVHQVNSNYNKATQSLLHKMWM